MLVAGRLATPVSAAFGLAFDPAPAVVGAWHQQECRFSARSEPLVLAAFLPFLLGCRRPFLVLMELGRACLWPGSLRRCPVPLLYRVELLGRPLWHLHYLKFLRLQSWQGARLQRGICAEFLWVPGPGGSGIGRRVCPGQSKAVDRCPPFPKGRFRHRD